MLNLLQSRFLFRMGDARDAEEATRIAMAVYATMIRDDPDSRARLRVTPEQALNFPNHYCLASWISMGSRIASFMGETYPLSADGREWADWHLAAQAERVGPYPETLEAAFDDATPVEVKLAGSGNDSEPTPVAASRREYLHVPFEEKDAAKQLGAKWDSGSQRWYIPAGRDPEPFARWREASHTAARNAPDHATGNGHQPRVTAVEEAAEHGTSDGRSKALPKREVRVDYQAPAPPPTLDDSPARRVAGRRVPGPPPGDHGAPAPDSVRDLGSSIGSTTSARPSSTRERPACRASTTRTTRSWRCSTALDWCQRR